MRTCRNLFALALLLPLVGCGGVVDERVVLEGDDHSRAVREDIDSAYTLDATSAERFPLPKRAGSRGPLKWEVPDGWASMEAGGMRMADFRFGDQGQGECYLASFPGGGDSAANVNRWRKQLGLEPVEAAAVAAMPAVALLGQPATLFDASGTYTGMLDPTPKPESRMLGAILNLGDRSLFVKMVGPAGLVAAQRENFLAFCESISFDASAAPPAQP